MIAPVRNEQGKVIRGKGIVDLWVWRDFVTAWSQIDMKLGKVLTLNPGYKVYTDGQALAPTAKGVGAPILIRILGAAEAGLKVTFGTMMMAVALLGG